MLDPNAAVGLLSSSTFTAVAPSLTMYACCWLMSCWVQVYCAAVRLPTYRPEGKTEANLYAAAVCCGKLIELCRVQQWELSESPQL